MRNNREKGTNSDSDKNEASDLKCPTAMPTRHLLYPILTGRLDVRHRMI